MGFYHQGEPHFKLGLRISLYGVLIWAGWTSCCLMWADPNEPA